MKTTRYPRSRVFWALLLGQYISVFGSGLTGFSLSVWIFEQTGSISLFTISALLSMLPMLLLAPFAGALADRWDRRKVIILGNCAAALITLVIQFLYSAELLMAWHIFIINVLSSTVSAVLGPAIAASVTVTVERHQFARASGLFQLVVGINEVLAPLIAPALLVWVGLQGVLIVDFITFSIMVLIMLLVRIPKPAQSTEGRARASLFKDAASGWHYIRARRGLLSLLLLIAIYNLGTGGVRVLLTPMVLTFADASALGMVSAAGGVGLLLGGLLMSIWSGPKSKVLGILGAMAMAGLVLLFSAWRQSIPLIVAASCAFLATTPIINACSAAIWQSKVPQDMQGRTFSIRLSVGWSTLPLAYLIAGPMAENVYEPAMAVGGALANAIGAWFGAGPGRGIALMIMLSGVYCLVLVTVALFAKRLRGVETELPDAI